MALRRWTRAFQFGRETLNVAVVVTVLYRTVQQIEYHDPDRDLLEKTRQLLRRNLELTAHWKEHHKMFDFLDSKMGSALKFAELRAT